MPILLTFSAYYIAYSILINAYQWLSLLMSLSKKLNKIGLIRQAIGGKRKALFCRAYANEVSALQQCHVL